MNVEGCLAQMAQVHSPHTHSPHAQVGEKHAETAGAERKAVTNTLSVWHVSRHVTLTQSDLLVSRAKSDSRQQIEWMVSTDHGTSNGHQVERLERCKCGCARPAAACCLIVLECSLARYYQLSAVGPAAASWSLMIEDRPLMVQDCFFSS